MFSLSKSYGVSPRFIVPVAQELRDALEAEGYTVRKDELASGDVILSITRGGFFKMVAGLKTALKCSFLQTMDGFRVEGEIGLFDTQAVPSTITLLVFWPLVVTQIVGLVKSRNLDRHIFDLIDASIRKYAP